MGSLVDPSYELVDPTPDVHALFVEYDRRFFDGRLAACEVKWSPRMTTCAGICCYEGRSGLCSIKLSTPLLKLRPRSDLVETLLHEMIHAFLFVTVRDRDRDGHGPQFQWHMRRINQEAGTRITIYHSFHAEVAVYKSHHWRCTGPCRERRPFFGWVKRASNRAPSKNDLWWTDHERSCGGTFEKVAEPKEYTEKREKAEKKKAEGGERKRGGSKKEGGGAKEVKDEKQPRIDAVFGAGGGGVKLGSSDGGSAKAVAVGVVTAAGGGGQMLGGGAGRSRLLDLFGTGKSTVATGTVGKENRSDDDDEIMVIEPPVKAIRERPRLRGGWDASKPNDDRKEDPKVEEGPPSRPPSGQSSGKPSEDGSRTCSRNSLISVATDDLSIGGGTFSGVESDESPPRDQDVGRSTRRGRSDEAVPLDPATNPNAYIGGGESAPFNLPYPPTVDFYVTDAPIQEVRPRGPDDIEFQFDNERRNNNSMRNNNGSEWSRGVEDIRNYLNDGYEIDNQAHNGVAKHMDLMPTLDKMQVTRGWTPPGPPPLHTRPQTEVERMQLRLDEMSERTRVLFDSNREVEAFVLVEECDLLQAQLNDLKADEEMARVLQEEYEKEERAEALANSAIAYSIASDEQKKREMQMEDEVMPSISPVMSGGGERMAAGMDGRRPRRAVRRRQRGMEDDGEDEEDEGGMGADEYVPRATRTRGARGREMEEEEEEEERRGRREWTMEEDEERPVARRRRRRQYSDNYWEPTDDEEEQQPAARERQTGEEVEMEVVPVVRRVPQTRSMDIDQWMLRRIPRRGEPVFVEEGSLPRSVPRVREEWMRARQQGGTSEANEGDGMEGVEEGRAKSGDKDTGVKKEEKGGRKKKGGYVPFSVSPVPSSSDDDDELVLRKKKRK